METLQLSSERSAALNKRSMEGPWRAYATCDVLEHAKECRIDFEGPPSRWKEIWIAVKEIQWVACEFPWNVAHTAPERWERTFEPEELTERFELEEIFSGLVDTWRKATGGYSLTVRRYAHPAYQAILVLGPEVVPLVLRELQTRPDRWFEALKVLTKEDPTKPTDSFEQAVTAWLHWGRRKNLIS